MNKHNVTDQEIKEISKRYIRRILRGFLNHNGSVSDYYLECPCCKRRESVIYNPLRGFWECRWRNCGYVIPKEVAPPSPAELCRLFRDILNPVKIKNFIGL